MYWIHIGLEVNLIKLNLFRTPKSLTRSLSTLSIAANANLLNLPLSSLALTIKPNPLELPHDRKHRQETYNKLNQLIFGIRQQELKAKKKRNI
ncbi:unnamed protein product [Rotaria magnacalcarata]|uniref:Uncharacterized protein n=1 Tax=Rotaria magnacalcarata TaxID=392030 RepID=A0A816HAP5_9BILA|nr:unnamed protein product [Rotaria magnacalcarata]CAF4972798.1 unnamed protein product [Rotaria magnacalcarata]